MKSQDHKTLFKDLGIKQTKARTALLKVFSSREKPLSVEEILSRINDQGILCDQATIYRTLDLLEKHQIIKKIVSLNTTMARYEINLNDHHHFTCDECGEIEEINSCNVESLIEKVKRKKNLLVRGHSLEFYGLCANCQN